MMKNKQNQANKFQLETLKFSLDADTLNISFLLLSRTCFHLFPFDFAKPKFTVFLLLFNQLKAFQSFKVIGPNINFGYFFIAQLS
jgi:hypothetical protein